MSNPKTPMSADLDQFRETIWQLDNAFWAPFYAATLPPEEHDKWWASVQPGWQQNRAYLQRDALKRPEPVPSDDDFLAGPSAWLQRTGGIGCL